MAGPVKIRVDLSAGTVEVEADAENIDALFDRLDVFIPRLSEAYGRPTEEDQMPYSKGMSPSAPAKLGQSADADPPNPIEQKGEVRKVAKAPRGKEVYTPVDLGLTETQRNEMREFYTSKQPKGQNEQIAVLMDWLKREGNKSMATWNDIFTAFRTVGVKSPAKISSVLGNMVGLSWVRNVGNGQYELIHVGEDYVKYDLPKAKSTNKA